MWLIILAFLTALSISSVSAYFSIVGLTAIFAAAKLPIIILGSTLEIGKIITTLFVHRHWKDLTISLKTYLSIAIIVLMMITSMGTFGFLSKAHLDQALPSDDNQIQLNIIDQKIKTDQDNITAAKQELSQLDQAVNQMMGRTTDATGAQRAVNIRKSQIKDRQRIADTIDTANKDLLALQQQEAPLKVEQNKIAVEVGPIKYIADLIYGQSEDPNILEKAVRIVILMLVSVFDPLAIVLLLAASSIMLILKGQKKTMSKSEFKFPSFFKKKEKEPHPILGEEPSGVKEFGVIPPPLKVVNDFTAVFQPNPEYESKIANLQESLEMKTSINESLTSALRVKEEEIHALKTNIESEAERITELLNNYEHRVSNHEDLHRDLREMLEVEKDSNENLQKANDELREELDIVNERFSMYVADSSAKIAELTDQLLAEQQLNVDLNNALTAQEGKFSEIMTKINELDTPEAHADRMFANNTTQQLVDLENADFGEDFPVNSRNGKLFVSTKTKPHTLYKFIDDYGWIVVDKSTTDSYITDEYAQFLVESIASGDFEFTDLTDREQERITEVLTK
jgi:cell division septum initiation protein DivIVA